MTFQWLYSQMATESRELYTCENQECDGVYDGREPIQLMLH